MNKNSSAGFTLFEIIIGIAILCILSAVVAFNFPSYRIGSDLNNSVNEFSSVLKLAQNRTISSDDASQYGVYINAGVSPNQYILFKGASYNSRIPEADQIYYLENTVEFYDINFGGGGEIVFTRFIGIAEKPGSVSIRVKTDASRNKTVYVAGSGTVSLDQPVAQSDANRITDTRQVYFNYNRSVDTANENIILTFDGGAPEVIPINSYLSSGELQWKGAFTVGEEDQTIEIITNNLINTGALFSIHRDRRYNTKSLEVALSGDISGTLAEYPADGASANYSSIYVTNFKQK